MCNCVIQCKLDFYKLKNNLLKESVSVTFLTLHLFLSLFLDFYEFLKKTRKSG